MVQPIMLVVKTVEGPMSVAQQEHLQTPFYSGGLDGYTKIHRHLMDQCGCMVQMLMVR